MEEKTEACVVVPHIREKKHHFLAQVSGSDSGTDGSTLHCTHNNLQLQLSTLGRRGSVSERGERGGVLNCVFVPGACQTISVTTNGDVPYIVL